MRGSLTHLRILASAFLTLAMGVSAHANDSRGDFHSKMTSIRGVPSYHAFYATVKSTTVATRGKAILRTEDGQTLEVPLLDGPQINLQDLTGIFKGIHFDLRQVTFPNNAAQIQLAEIEVQLNETSCNNNNNNLVTFTDNKTCRLNVPKRLIFYTQQAIPLEKLEYWAKVPFAPLNGLTFDLAVFKTYWNSSHHHGKHHKYGWNQSSQKQRGVEVIDDVSSGSDDNDDDDSDDVPASQERTKLRCELSNQRYQITQINDRANEA